MSVLISCQNLSKRYGAKSLFEDLDFGLFQGDRVGLIGENGVGKSTLLKMLYGSETCDDGIITKKQGLKLAMVDQDSELPMSDQIKGHLYRVIGETPYQSSSEGEKKVSLAMREMGCDDGPINKLSGGYKKRLSIVAQLIREPDLLLLDEPTNHLDFRGVIWLQDLLNRAKFGFMVVSHDRYFLEKTVQKVAEISALYPNGIYILEGGYDHFIMKSQEYKDGLNAQARSMASKLRREEEWLSRGPKARSTKSKSRIQAAGQLKEDLQDVKSRLKEKELNISFSATGRKTRKLVEAEDLAIGYHDKCLVSGLSFTLMPYKVMGITGPNGCGKSTLLKILAQESKPLSGDLKVANDLKVVYFDQQRETLDPDEKLGSALTDETGAVRYQNRLIHVNAWATKFGFTRDQLELKVCELSGGEKARLLVSRLVRQEADILLLDEPTNDLDISTLEVLEEGMSAFNGAIVIISHDRYLISKICDEIVGFLGSGEAHIYGSYEQWEKAFIKDLKPQKSDVGPDRKTIKSSAKKPNKKKLSYMDQREFDQMEDKIMAAEQVLELREKDAQDPEIVSHPERAKKAYEDLEAAQREVERLYARWAELDV